MRTSAKNLGLSSNGKIEVRISNNQQRTNQRVKTDFIAEIYCPRKKSEKKAESREKVRRIEFKVDVSNVFWRKKSTALKQTTGSSSI